jgi:hypothetical protein
MKLRFPLSDVTISICSEKRIVSNPTYTDQYYTLNQNEFSMDVEEVGYFYVSNGNYIELLPYTGVNDTSLELYLNGSVYGAILHQRMILPMHGSSFIYKDKGIMICGESGAGKSSLTTAFHQNGATFLTDDVTPILFENKMPIILPLSDRIKLWDDSLNQLGMQKENHKTIADWYDKYYLSIDAENQENCPLDTIFILGINSTETTKIELISGIDTFTSLRNQIYRWEYLPGMKQSEKRYLADIMKIIASTNIYLVSRPIEIEIESLKQILEDFIRTMNN